MLKEVCGSRYEDKVKTGSFISPEVTAGRLIRILEHGNFKSGDHVCHADAP
ncbi:unnamed protein product [Ixodes pacificus]